MRFNCANGSRLGLGADLEITWGAPKTFQNLSVSSAAADATVQPSGLCAMNSTLEVCPLSSAIFTIEGYFHSVSWFCVKPWELSNSLSFLFQSKAQTWDPVSTEFKHAPVWVFQNFIHRSPPPPPVANKLLWKGHQAIALTADVCSSSLWSHCVTEFEEAIDLSHMWRRLSLPPLANCCPEADHFSPHTSWWWPLYVSTIWSLTLTSLLIIRPSIPPVVRMWLFHARDPTLDLWPPLNVLSCLLAVESHSCTWQLFKPMAIWRPSGAQLTLVTGPFSSSTVTSSDVVPSDASQR